MKKLTFIFAFLATYFAQTSFAAIVPHYQDIKLPTQQMVEKQNFGTPTAAGTNTILNASAGPTSAAVATVTTFAGQPDVPRNLVITPGGTTTDVESCIVTVTGLNYYSKVISETFSFAADASTATTGSKAFKTVTSVSWAANCESGGFAATWSIGVGEKLGLKYCIGTAGDWLQGSVAGVYESTRATVVASASAVESNTADFNGTMNGSNTLLGYFFQNYLCKP